MSLFTVASCPWEVGDRERQREDERRDGGECWAATNVSVMSQWFISISASHWPEKQFHMCELSETLCLWRDKRLQHSPSLLLSFPSLAILPATHLGSEKVHVLIYKSLNSYLPLGLFGYNNRTVHLLFSLWVSSVTKRKMCYSIWWYIFFAEVIVLFILNSVNAVHGFTYDSSKISTTFCLFP